MQIKIPVRYHLMPIEMAIIKNKTKQKTTSIGDDVEQLEPLYFPGGHVKWYSH